jgi:uncharacterized protein
VTTPANQLEQLAGEPSRRLRFTRRRFLAGAALAACGTGLYTWRIEPHWVEVVERELPIAGLPAALQDRTLVQISDLHVGNAVDTDYLIRSMQRISALKPAMTVITGDFMTCRKTEQIDKVLRVLEHLQPGPLGCFAVCGNHDYSQGWSKKFVADELEERLQPAGVHLLRNATHTVEGLQFVGIDDLWSPCFRPMAIVPQVDWSRPTLTLCHNPDAVDHAALAPCRGWILSGHTHGGQCKPPFLPPPLLPVRNRRYTCGEFDIGHGRRLYINRGLGHLLRVRFNVRPEITVFRLSRA